MKVKTVHTTLADQKSAHVFFGALRQMYDLTSMSVLDAFARNGELTVKNYGEVVRRLECWELGWEHKEDLLKITPNVVIGDSYDALENAVFMEQKFDLIVIDTPQGIHKDGRGQKRYEHWDFLRRSAKLIERTGLFVLYVNKEPYDRDRIGSHGYDEYVEYDYREWMRVRQQYYGSSIITEEDAISAYRQDLRENGLVVTGILSVPCYSDVPGLAPYAFRLALAVERVEPTSSL
jgi:hypothetical protein